MMFEGANPIVIGAILILVGATQILTGAIPARVPAVYRAAKSRVICSRTFGSTTRVSPVSGSFSE